MLGIRNKQKADDSVPNEDALKMFHDYIGAVEVDTTEQNELEKAIEEAKEQQSNLKSEIEEMKKELEAKQL